MAQTGAVIDVVRPKDRADELLEEIVIFVGAFCRPKTGQRLATKLLFDRHEALRCQI